MNNKSITASARLRPMSRRDPDELHRSATPLELLFDLVSVIAIAAAAAGLHHAIVEAHIVEGIFKFVCAFFGIWWAWMNYTWFASAYDNDDTVFRLLTMVIMAGALIIAAGIGAFFESLDLYLVVIGYVIMRLGMIALWLRAARHDTKGGITARWYAGGIALAQVYWVIFLISLPLTNSIFFAMFAIGVVLELVVPVVAENKSNTPWHRHHIMERYGLLNIIVLGETLLAASMAMEKAMGQTSDFALVRIAVSALVILFSMWWLYFSREDHLQSNSLSRALIWGYGHFLIFASGAAVGAGIAAMVDIVAAHSTVSIGVGRFAVAISVATYLGGLWLVRDRYVLNNGARLTLPLFAAAILLVPLFQLPLEVIALLSVLCVITRNRLANNSGQ